MAIYIIQLIFLRSAVHNVYFDIEIFMDGKLFSSSICLAFEKFYKRRQFFICRQMQTDTIEASQFVVFLDFFNRHRFYQEMV